MSLERDVEQGVIELLSTDVELAAMCPRPRDEDQSRHLPQLKVSATAGERMPSGCKPWNLVATVELRANQKDTSAGKLDRLWTLAERAMERHRGLTYQTTDCKFLLILPESTSERTSADDSRLRSRKYPLLALPSHGC